MNVVKSQNQLFQGLGRQNVKKAEFPDFFVDKLAEVFFL
jgi:hypothetical protein